MQPADPLTSLPDLNQIDDVSALRVVDEEQGGKIGASPTRLLLCGCCRLASGLAKKATDELVKQNGRQPRLRPSKRLNRHCARS